MRICYIKSLVDSLFNKKIIVTGGCICPHGVKNDNGTTLEIELFEVVLFL